MPTATPLKKFDLEKAGADLTKYRQEMGEDPWEKTTENHLNLMLMEEGPGVPKWWPTRGLSQSKRTAWFQETLERWNPTPDKDEPLLTQDLLTLMCLLRMKSAVDNDELDTPPS